MITLHLLIGRYDYDYSLGRIFFSPKYSLINIYYISTEYKTNKSFKNHSLKPPKKKNTRKNMLFFGTKSNKLVGGNKVNSGFGSYHREVVEVEAESFTHFSASLLRIFLGFSPTLLRRAEAGSIVLLFLLACSLNSNSQRKPRNKIIPRSVLLCRTFLLFCFYF